MNHFISVRDLWYTYPNGVEALREINLDLDLGDFVAIMGENGAGKTTLVKLFNGLLRPTRGCVLVDGIDTREATVAELSRKVGYVFQNPLYQLFADNVEKEVAMGPKAFGLSSEEVSERVENALETLTIKKHRNKHPLMLSEGERKRVALASVLSMKPKVLMLDEPSLGQDAREKKGLAALLRELHSSGSAIILVTHDIEFVFDVAERLVVLSKGRVVADGPKREIVKKKDVLIQASLVVPQIPRLASSLNRYGILEEILTVEEACESLLPLLKGGEEYE